MRTRSGSHAFPRHRRGVTIIETLVLITMVAAMLGQCVILLQLLMKLEADGRARVETSSALARLSEQFRSDVHAARSATLKDGQPAAGGELRLQRSRERTVDYQLSGEGRVLRLESERGKPIRRERYDVQRGGSIAIKIDREGDRQFVRLILNPRAKRSADEPSRIFEIVAVVGRNSDRQVIGGQ